MKSKHIAISPRYNKEHHIYTLQNFTPKFIDKKYLSDLGVSTSPSQTALSKLQRGSELFLERLQNQTLLPEHKYNPAKIDINAPFEIHNYTGQCPTLTYEVTPVTGCHLGCLYCLVTDGQHQQPLTLFTNYNEAVTAMLEKNYEGAHYFYFSAKTEALQEPTLQSGLAHRILRSFISHFERHPNSKARLFIASKAGKDELLFKHEGATIVDLFGQLKGRMQFNTSLSIMPSLLRELLEPNAPPLEKRLEAVSLCHSHGVMANSALIQPILPVGLSDDALQTFFRSLRERGIINYKPEFLTVCPENLAMIGQIVGFMDKNLERDCYEVYLEPANEGHIKQRSRTAPLRDLSKQLLNRMLRITDSLDMTASICYWVRKELSISKEVIPIINRNGFQCLGYQSRLFKERP